MANPFRKYGYYLVSIFELLGGVREWPLVLRIFVRTFLGAAPAGPKVISLRKSGAQFAVRGPMDIWSVKETFIDRFYERCGTPVGEGWNVVDIGGGIGEFTLFAALHHPTNRVFAFEPFPPSFILLQENVNRNHVQNVQAFQEAVGEQSGSLTLDLSLGEPLKLQSRKEPAVEDQPAAETQPAAKNQPAVANQPAANNQPFQQAITVPCLSLQDAYARLNLDRCDLLKLDCEGAEYGILFYAPDQTLQQTRQIVMEYHDGVTEYNHADLVKFLSEKGFRVQVTPNQVHADIGYLYASRDKEASRG